jgi:hypothetical protein
MVRAACCGALFAILLAFPLAAFAALVYRFPIPFGGYESGPSALPLVVMAVILYGKLGGFTVLGVLGAIAGVVANRRAPANARRTLWLTLQFSFIVSLAGVMTLAVLDKIIGPW